MSFSTFYSLHFHSGQLPANIMTGEYNIYLVLLSYLIASVASYVALDMSAHLRQPTTTLFRILWLLGGAFVMGAGIWSMHFVGMLAFIMPMPMVYDYFWTGLSMLTAVLAAGMAFLFLMVKNPSSKHYLLSGIILGSAIPTMHYLGMAGMDGVKIHYKPGLFCLSIVVAIIAATASIWLSTKSDHGTFINRLRIKSACALIMGLAIVGMHYIGMFAAIFTPTADMVHHPNTMDPILLAIFITTIVMSVMIVALILSTSKYLYSTKMKEQNDFLISVLDNIRAGVVACDAHGQITLLNRTAQDILGEKINFMGLSIVNNNEALFTLHEGDQFKNSAIEINSLISDLIKGNAYHCEKGFIKTSNNHFTPISFSINPLPLIESEQFNGAVLIFINIIERLKNETALKLALKAAQQANQAKSNFLANMSHEIRTPLNGVMGMIQLLQLSNLSDKQKHYADMCLESSTNLLKIIGDTLDFSKIEAGKLSFENVSFNLTKELDPLMVTFEAQCLQKGLNIHIAIDNNIPSTLIGDPDKIKQIINNLVNNAIKFTPSEGKITIDINVDKVFECNLIIQFSITDSGIGIPSNVQSKIFEMFSQADESTTRKYGGTGLGLAITKQLVELMGGEINVSSDGKHGSTFLFTLNLGYRGNLSEIKNSISSKLKDCSSHLDVNILLVDDNELNRELVSEILKKLGYNIDAVNSGHAALNAIQKTEYKLIFMDCQMPEMDGFVTTQKIRDFDCLINKGNHERIIIALTANALQGTQNRCLEAGMNDYVTKPFNYEQLIDIIHKYIH